MFAVATLVITASVGAVSAAPPTAQELTAFNQGQAYQRLFQDHLMPGTCGIVLERSRCLADFQTVRALRGPDPSDSAMQAWLVNGSLALAVKTWNGNYIPDKTWVERPDFAWWYTAGEVSIAASLPENAASTDYLSALPGLFSGHDNAAPPGFQGLIASTGTPFERLKPLQKALGEAIPATPYPEPSFAQGVRGDVQLGIYVSTLQELIDNSLALSRPESRVFGLVAVNRLRAINDKYATGASLSVVSAALLGNVPDESEINPLREALSAAISTKWPLAERQAYMIGALTAQVAYNAAVLRDVRADTGFRSAIFSVSPYNGMSPQVRADLLAMRAIPSVANGGSWDAINQAASRATTDMAASP